MKKLSQEPPRKLKHDQQKVWYLKLIPLKIINVAQEK